MTMLRTAEIDMANSVAPSDIAIFLTNAAWAIRSTYHTVLKASPGAAIFGRDMLFNIPYIADWNKIGDHSVIGHGLLAGIHLFAKGRDSLIRQSLM